MSEQEKHPPAPHPRRGNNVPELPPDKDNPMIKECHKKLKELYKDIELNWRRLGYRHKSTKLILVMIMDLLYHCMEILPYEEEEYQEKKEKEERENMTFSTSKDGIS